jgi:hypothetical protein
MFFTKLKMVEMIAGDSTQRGGTLVKNMAALIRIWSSQSTTQTGQTRPDKMRRTGRGVHDKEIARGFRAF